MLRPPSPEGSKMRRLLLFLLVLAVFIQPAFAYDDYNTSGSINYQYGQSNSYTLGTDSNCWYGVVVPTCIHHRFTDAKYFNSLYVSGIYKRSTGVEYTINDYTTFTATVDGIYYGCGIVGMIEDTSTNICFDLDFTEINESYADTLSGIHNIVLSYDGSILSDVTRKYLGYPTASAHSNFDTILTSVNPSALESSQNADVYTDCNYFAAWSSAFSNDYDYSYNSTTGLSSINIDKLYSSSKWNIHNFTGGSYFYESAYNLNDIDQSFLRGAQVRANVTFYAGETVHVTRTIDPYGTDEEEEDEDDYTPCEVSTDNSSYLRGDMVTVYYNTSTAGELRVYVDQNQLMHQRTITGPTVDGVWTFYISDDEPLGLYQVMLTNSLNDMLDTAYYNLTSSGSVLSVVPEYSELYDNIFIWYQTINESVLSIVAIEPDPDVEVYNATVNSSSLTYLEWTPTVYTGVYNFYLYDDETLTDNVSVWYAAAPDIPEPTPDPDATPTASPLVDRNNDGEYTEDEIKDFSMTMLPFFWFMLVLMFFVAFIGRAHR